MLCCTKEPLEKAHKIVIEDGGVRELVTAIARFTTATKDHALIEKRMMSIKM